MQEFIDWISHYNNLIPSVQVFVASVTAFATVVLAFVTWNLAQVSKREAYVVCTISPAPSLEGGLHAVIKNTGNATAFDIEIKLESDRDLPTDKKELILNFSLLTPGQVLHPHSNLFDWKTQTKIYATITWASKPNRRKQKPLKYIIDDSDKNKRGRSENAIKNISIELRGIRRLIEAQNIATSKRDRNNQ